MEHRLKKISEPLKRTADRLNAQQASCVILRGDTFTELTGRGVKPLAAALQENADIMRNAALADKIIGRAAALLMVFGGVREVFGGVMSEPAAEVFSKYAVPWFAETLVPRIIARDGVSLCPMEQRALEIDDPAEAFRVFGAICK